MVNTLGSETSPYLLQHKDNPVHWQPWGEAAFAAARQAGLLVHQFAGIDGLLAVLDPLGILI